MSRSLDIGAEIGPFRVAQLLGEGGVGRVYAALDTDLGRMVALKALRPELANDAGFVDRFRAEAASLARLQHPNITTLYALHREGAALYMVMELVRGYTLEELLQHEGTFTLPALRAVAAQACAGLAYAHRMGVIHRDLKTANLMLTEHGQLKIMDFGIARVRGSQRMTRAGNIIGTLAYMPPEQIKGAENDERSDIYSLGCVFYELLSGATPFRAETEYDLIQAQIGSPPPPLRSRRPELDTAIESALLQALAKAPAERFATVGAFAQSLGAVQPAGEAEDTARDILLARRPKLADIATPSVAAPSVAGKRPPLPEAATPAAAARPPKRAFLPLPALVLGGVVLLLACGFAATMLLQPHDVAVPVAPVDAPENTAATAAPAAASAVPASPNIYAAPDAQSRVNTEIARQELPPCPPPAGDAGVVQGPVDGVSGDGWPQVAGTDLRLYGVQQVTPDARSRLASWLSRKGNALVCCAVGDAHRCLTAETHQDVGMYLLMNGLARSDGTAARAYLDAEADARSNHRGEWK